MLRWVISLVTAVGLAAPAWSEGTYELPERVQIVPRLTYYSALPEVYFRDTGESRWTKSGRVLNETIGGVRGVSNDLFDIATAPVRKPVLFGAAAVGTAFLVLNDYEFTSFYQDKIEPIFDGFDLPPIVNAGQLADEDEFLLAGIAATYAYGFAFNDERAQVAAVLSSKAIAYSYLTSHVLLKPVFGRARPTPNLSSYPKGSTTAAMPTHFTADPYRWRESGGIQFRAAAQGTSFPSYHYTQFFAAARVYSGVYDNSLLPYAAATLLSVSNIRGHRHWVSDMAAGAFLGTVIGQVVLNNYSERRGISFDAMPSVSRDGAGITFTMNF
ncbi:phosphatase PAP2 family protein [Maritimibacter sp. DP1N21-5]|uniref:phosphatase PAP2 family protein n=1 Tax=Maritimibacter sp. DP1N21-5 TaxID=2836867 RepID=UPI001C47CD3F|nr:phosphatase PAP2 family protein [Maritimibacter sp. DP1N21-5]MBV7410721.1 phosphatase PAP2 family protein [Maritimibacter sp. DP1N21-5]